MQQHRWLSKLHGRIFSWRHLLTEELIALCLVVFLFAVPSAGAMRLQERSLYMQSSVPGATTAHTVSFRYMSPSPVGSVKMSFCVDPIPYHDCVTPPGLDVSGVNLTEQAGEAGYSILSRSTNEIVLSRINSDISIAKSSYTFTNVKNPTDTNQAFSIRLSTHTSTNASGPVVDFGSVRGQVTNGLEISTQVPPMLIFCVAEEVADNCAETNQNHYTDMGELSSDATLTAQSQMAVGTNASAGFAITANGTPFSAGSSVVDSPQAPTESQPGVNQFGINLVANNAPSVGEDPEGTWANAIASPDYAIPNKYKFVPGDVVAYSPNVSLMKKFTVSYVINSQPDLKPGVYSTTITYIASGRF